MCDVCQHDDEIYSITLAGPAAAECHVAMCAECMAAVAQVLNDRVYQVVEDGTEPVAVVSRMLGIDEPTDLLQPEPRICIGTHDPLSMLDD